MFNEGNIYLEQKKNLGNTRIGASYWLTKLL